MSKVLRVKSEGGQRTTELLEYDDSWLPWKYCIRRTVADGNAYGRPGQRTCTGWCNYETLEEAERAFE